MWWLWLPLLLSPIILPCVDDCIHICSAFLWGQEVMRASYARMTRQDFFCAPSIPILLPTDWLTALWLRPSPSQLLLSSLLSSLLKPMIWCEWMLTLGGGAFCNTAFTHQLKFWSGEGRREEGRKVAEKDLFRNRSSDDRKRIYISKGELGLCRK